jgi:hypothetical protein
MQVEAFHFVTSAVEAYDTWCEMAAPIIIILRII